MKEKKNKSQNTEKGVALITLLVFTMIALTITSAAIIVLYVNARATSTFQSGTGAYYIAESGLENGLIRLIRDPGYTGETVQLGSGSATITVSGANPWTVGSVGKIGDSVRSTSVDVTLSSGSYSFTNWKEIE